jgi:protein SCO1
MLRIIRWSALGLVVLLGLAWGALEVAGTTPAGRAFIARVAGRIGLPAASDGAGAFGLGIGGPFHLTDPAGKSVTDATYRGRWMLVYFGYTSCPDVCPTELATIAAALHQLGPEADRVAPLFITIDPARDTPQVLSAYVRLFDRRLIGLTGTPAEIAEAARAYRVYYAKLATGEESAYLMDHSSFIYLMGPDGSFEDLFRPGAGAADIATSIRSRIARQG